MKQTILISFALILTCLTSSAQHNKMSSRVSPHDTVTSKNIVVTYGRPYTKGRVIFGDGKSSLETYGKVWRTGADEATEITLKHDCMFAGKPVKAGTYTLFTVPNPKDWGIILNSKLGQWGAFGYDKVKDKDVLKASVHAMELDHVVEQFTISAKDNGLMLEWDKTQVFIPVSFKD